MTMPQLPFDDAATSTDVSITATLIGCEVRYGSSYKVDSGRSKGNVLVQLRKKIFRSDKNYAAAARQALGLDNTQSSESLVTQNSIDISCKGLRYPISSTQSLPPTKNSRKQLVAKRDDNNSLPPPSSSRRRLASIDSSSSMMDESCSGSILNDLLMEVYKDPYEDFLQKLKTSKKMAGKVEDIEVDVLTQLPAIKATMSPMRTRSSRRLTHQTASSTRAIMSSRSSNNQHVKVGREAPGFSNIGKLYSVFVSPMIKFIPWCGIWLTASIFLSSL